MGITMNIIAHELKAHGTVVRTQTSDQAFADVRLYLGVESINPDRSDLLYLTDDASQVPQGSRGGINLIYIGTPERPSVSGASCSFVGDMDLFEALTFLQDVFLAYSEWEEAMDASCLANEGIQRLLDLSEPFLANNTVVVDPALKLLAHTTGIECDDPITVELINHGYHTEENIRKFKLNKRFAPWATQNGFIVNDTRRICKYTTIVYSFKTRDSFSIILIMMCNHIDPAPYLFDIFSILIRRVAHYVEREYPEGKPSGSSVDSFLRDLIEGHINTHATIMERCEFAGIPYEAQFCLFHIDSSSNSAPTPRLLADVAREVAPAKALIVKQAVVVLCFNCANSSCPKHCRDGACPQGCNSVSNRLSSLLARYGMVCGRSSTFTTLDQARGAYLQARAAERIGVGLSDSENAAHASRAALRRRPQLPGIFPFDLYYFDHLINVSGDEGIELLHMTNAYRTLKRIAEQDERMNTDNYEFLFHYLANERRASVVAEKLPMHRNNVKYRIDRIEKTFGIDTSDAETRRDLTFAYAIDNAIIMPAAPQRDAR
ncbi:MAG TPA: helix-turn-helix domain-containing protein [Candidatus Aphodovivens excrementavium]|nr:helix-turn-helix domain-containing protein [Candidatus Aphodovivens avistercoris]HIT44578.1 helix-turn-helix domain-containing protein [Candidatus Aphodovivens excrementavium]